MKKILLSIIIICSCAQGSQAQSSDQIYRQYIEKYKDIAIEQMQKWKVPASITLAQGLLESAAGRSRLATEGNNHFGIKCHSSWKGGRIYADDEKSDECFRRYRTARESYEDHSVFLANGQRYRSLFNLKLTDYKGWAKGLKAAGYASNPVYAQSLINLIERYELYRYDTATPSKIHSTPVNGQPLHPIYMYNKNYYLYARRGDTYRTIAQETGVSYRKLARYNERDKNDVLEEGEIVWLEKKRSKAPKEMKKRPHQVQPGESMYLISQKYGVRLKSLYKLNKLNPDEYHIQVGDMIRVR